jgi:hypothetical protein
MKKLLDYLTFKKMVSSFLLRFVYLVGIAALIIWAIDFFIKGNGISIVAGFLVLIFGNLIWRVTCELWIVLFSIHDTLRKSEEHLKILSDTVRK